MKGGFVIIPDLFSAFDEVNAAILKFQREVTDPKAVVLPTYNTVGDIVRVFFLNLCCRLLSDTEHW
jgi:cation transporter-like permease